MITRGTAQTEPPTSLGPLHDEAIAIMANAVGVPDELDQLEQLALQSEGAEGEMIGWQIEAWIARHGSSLIPPAPPD